MLMKPKILVVDDDRSVRESLRKLLEAHGYEVLSAGDATEALGHFHAQPVDLVVLDINLGVDNGWQVFEAMAIKNPFVPTIVITAEWGQREQAVTLGVEGLIEKPIDVPVLLNMISELLAETTEAKSKRICSRDTYCRFVGRHYEPYLRLLQQRYAAPFKLAARCGVPATAEPEVDTELPTVIPASSGIRGWRAEFDRTRTASGSIEQPGRTHEADHLKRLG